MLGDLFKKITNKLGFETCEACEKRRKELNFAFPWLKYRTARILLLSDVIFINDCILDVWNINQQKKRAICEIYAYTFNLEYYEPNLNHISPFITMLERLEKVIKLQEKKNNN